MNDIVRPPKQSVQPTPQRPQAQPVASQSATNTPKLIEPSGEPLLAPPKKRRLRWWILGIASALIVLIAAVLAAGYIWYKEALKPIGAGTQQISVTVESGDTIEQISQKLQDSGAVKSALATQLYMRLNGKDEVKTGHYVFEPNQSVAEIVEWLTDGRVDTFKVTILPGKTLAELKQSLLEYGYSPEELDAAFAKTYNNDLFADAPAGISLEGYLYPETYFVTTGSSAEELFSRAFDEFQAQLTKASIREKLKQRNLTLHQGVILASLVSGEVSDFEDRRKVAQVFEKRLKEDMPLGSDVSFTYAAKQLGIRPSPNIDSPYNTRKVVGLPPGPVSNFTLDSIAAVAEPANTSYLYFVSGDDGVTRFSFTEEEHEQNVQKYCRQLCGLE